MYHYVLLMLCKFCIFAQPKNKDKIMVAIKAFIRTSKKNKNVNVRFRLTDGRDVQLFYASEITVNPTLWDSKNEQYKAKSLIPFDERIKFNSLVSEYKNMILSLYARHKNEMLDSDKFTMIINKKLNPEKQITEENNLFSLLLHYIDKHVTSDNRKKNYKVIHKTLQRYQYIMSLFNKKSMELQVQSIHKETIMDIERFIANEHELYHKYERTYQDMPATIRPRLHQAGDKMKLLPRGHNTIVSFMKRLRSFFSWLMKEQIIETDPFSKYEIGSEKYGTPVYITLQERNIIAGFDLSNHPALEAQRDIFIFQCLIGCRISDLTELTQDNLINGAIEYVPHKTIGERPQVVRVPLNNRANELVEKYKGKDCKGRLFPFISQQRYNDAIKDIFRICGITRKVTIINPSTGKEEKRPINEIASSHMARRTFIGNLYKQVKDPNLVGALSGHKEGSKAFTRYREIDDDIKQELVDLLE